MSIFRKLGPFEPDRRKFLATICHVLPAEHAKRKHLSGGKLRHEPAAEGAPHRLRPKIDVSPLHFVIHPYGHSLHLNSFTPR